MALTTDITPRINLTPDDVVKDESRMKRLQATLCAGIFSHANDDDADKIVDECLKICGRSEDTLASILQLRFFLGHTPFYWVILNKRAISSNARPASIGPLDYLGEDAPPLLIKFLEVFVVAQRELDKSVQEDIMEALRVMYDSDVYAAVMDRLTDVPTHDLFNEDTYFSAREDRIRVGMRQTGDVAWDKRGLYFNIPKFFDRILVDGSVWFEFPMKSPDLVFRFMASVKGVSKDFWARPRLQFFIKAKRKHWDNGRPSWPQDHGFSLQLHPSDKNGTVWNSPISENLHFQTYSLETEWVTLNTTTSVDGLRWRLNPTRSECRDLSGVLAFQF